MHNKDLDFSISRAKLMDVPSRPYSVLAFYRFLNESAKRYFQQLKLVCLLKFPPEGMRSPQSLALDQFFRERGFEVRSLGDITEVSKTLVDYKTAEKTRVQLFCHYSHDNQIVKCFTTDRSEDVDRALRHAFSRGGLSYLWINPIGFEELKNRILNYKAAIITYFAASRDPSTRADAYVRPNVERTIIYSGSDGEETFQELKYQYGVIPEVFRFHVPEQGDVQASRKGVFIYYGGSFSFVNSTADSAIDIALQTKGIFDSSKVEVIRYDTSRRHLELNQFTPWTIEFARDVHADDVEQLFAQLQSDRFAIYNSVVLKGSIHAESTILDEANRTIFTLTHDQRRMTISPR